MGNQYRPVWHYLPEEGLLWDPCAAVHHNDRYHFFYLHSSWKKSGIPRRSDGYIYKSWSHISSLDLLNWEQHPDALDRAQTGNLFIYRDKPTIIFPHPDGGGASCFAKNHSKDLEKWEYSPKKSVLRHPVQGNGLYPNSNDVTAWNEEDSCFVITGTRESGGGDTMHLFKSKDLETWEYIHQFYKSKREWTSDLDDCACPDFFKIGSKWMLLHFCHQKPDGGSRYYLGSYERDHFYPESFDRINFPGGNIHAPRSMLDLQGRRILFFNLNEGRKHETCVKSGWSGVLSIPVVISLSDNNNSIEYRPIDELRLLRGEEWYKNDLKISKGEEKVLKDLEGDSLEIDVEMVPDKTATFGLNVRCSPNKSEQTSIFFSRNPDQIKIDFRNSSQDVDLDYHSRTRIQTAPYSFTKEKLIRLRIFLDKSVLEVFAGHQRYMAQRIYPKGSSSLLVSVFSLNGETVFHHINAWKLSSNLNK